MCMLALLAVCQKRVVTGTVTDDKGVAVEAASIIIQGTRIGTTTDQFGNYRLANVAPNATFQVSAINIITKTVNVSASVNVNVVIQRTADSGLAQVTIGALGIRKRSTQSYHGTPVDSRLLINGRTGIQPGMGGSIITGVVTDDKGAPLEGVSVRIASTKASTGTDSLGHYSIYAASDTCTLVFETAGTWPVRENIKGRAAVNLSFVYPDPAYGYYIPEEKKEEVKAKRQRVVKTGLR